ncbi:unnamed protein product [Fraxinus pennsylvanica]|uniref:RING-type E3 ubiquitin transferase n=1 Tax=Fraxinus pennsylvanica TaxID=56036 RepID=A0AAD1ZTW8_9LAMI|nr:unnamed protein product [Fraxinus pennsylvanica]
MLNFSLSGSPFQASYTINYTFLNCSSDRMDYASYQFVPLSCLNGENHSVFALNLSSSDQGVPASCRRIMNVSVLQYQQLVGLQEDLLLIWKEPGCGDRESQDSIGRFKNDTRSSSPPNRGKFIPSTTESSRNKITQY